MAYKNFEELKHLPKDKAKYFYKEAHSRFIAAEKGEYFKLHIPVVLGQALGSGIALHFYNSTHLFIYTGIIGACIGLFFTNRLIQQKMKPYIHKVVNESST